MVIGMVCPSSQHILIYSHMATCRGHCPYAPGQGFLLPHSPSGCSRRKRIRMGVGMRMVCPSSPAAVSGSPAWP